MTQGVAAKLWPWYVRVCDREEAGEGGGAY